MRGKVAPRVLVIDEELPWPANTGKRLRTLNLMSCLAREFEIDYLVHGRGMTREAIDEMQRRGIRVIGADSGVPAKGGAMLPLRLVASVLSGRPYSVHSHTQAGFRRALRNQLDAVPYDLIHCEWTPYAVYLDAGAPPACIAAHNVEWEIWRRMAASESRLIHRCFFALQALLMERFERRVFGASQYVTAVSDGDAATIRSIKPQDIVVVPNGVDADAYRPASEPADAARTLVFSGSMDWRPNQDAIRWFIDEVHPLLLQTGNYRLHVVGRQPPGWLGDASVVPPQVIVTGTVDDVRPYIAQAAVYIVPLRIGGGSRLKILEALAMAKAVVSTTVGAEGLDVRPGHDILIADGPAAFAGAIMSLWQNPSTRQVLGSAGRDLVERQYRWEQIAPLQSALWRRAAARAPV